MRGSFTGLACEEKKGSGDKPVLMNMHCRDEVPFPMSYNVTYLGLDRGIVISGARMPPEKFIYVVMTTGAVSENLGLRRQCSARCGEAWREKG